MQGAPQTLPDCSKRASLAEVRQFQPKKRKKNIALNRCLGASLTTLAGNFRPTVKYWNGQAKLGALELRC
jgi:hypothetical protein